MVKQHFSCVTRVNLTRVTRLVCSYLNKPNLTLDHCVMVQRANAARWARPFSPAPSLSKAPQTWRSPPSLRCMCCGSWKREINSNAVVFGCMRSSVGAQSWVSFTTSSRNSVWMTAGCEGFVITIRFIRFLSRPLQKLKLTTFLKPSPPPAAENTLQ